MNIIQIKRSEVTATPNSLAVGELAYSEDSSTLFIGMGDGSIVSIGGVAFTQKLNGIATGANKYVLPSDVVQDANYISTDNNFTASYKNKLNGIATGANKYVLPSDVVQDANYISTDNNFTTTLKTKLDGLANYLHPTTSGNRHIPSGGVVGQILRNSANGTVTWEDEQGAVTSVAGRTGDVILSGNDVGLGNVANTADGSKNVNSATKLTTPRTIAGANFDGSANISISLAHVTKDSNNRAITDAQLTQLSTLYGWYSNMTTADADGLIDTISEVLNAFSDGAEGLNVASELQNPTAMNLDGGTF